MEKVKFNIKFYDKVEGVMYTPSTDFVEVPKHVLDRLREREKFSKGEYDYDEPKPVKKPAKSKLSD